jgi:hypothetical protein
MLFVESRAARCAALKEFVMLRLLAFVVALFAVAVSADLRAQTTAEGATFYANFNCTRSGCHTPRDSRISRGTSWTTIFNAANGGVTEMTAVLGQLGGVSEYQAQALSCFVQSWFGPPTDPWCAGTAAGLQMPSQVGFGVQTVGTTTSPVAATITNSGGSAITITNVASDNAAEFPITGNSCVGTLNAGASCQITVTFRPASTGTRSANISVFVSGSATPQQFLAFGAGEAATGGSNYTGLYWNSPAGSEDGWGLNVSHQGDTMFVTWFTYDANRKGWWLVMIANKTAEGVYKGDLLETSGPAFSTVPFNPSGSAVTNRKVGSGTLDFVSTEGPKFEIEIGTQPKITKRITRQLLGTAPIAVCATRTGSATAATNYQDLWWAAPARSEDGWGINLTHQGDTIFATWFTYDIDRTPMWLVVTAQKTANGVYSGRLYRTTGTPYNAATYSGFGFTDVGSLTLTFANGNSATMSYTINGVAPATVTQTKSIIRQVLVEPGTVCQ